MAKYTLRVKLPDQQIISYSLDLNSHQESYPEQVFTAQIREEMRQSLESQSGCTINDYRLNKIIGDWLGDIRVGFKATDLERDLPSTEAEVLKDLQDQGNQQIPDFVIPDLTEIEPLQGMFPPLLF